MLIRATPYIMMSLENHGPKNFATYFHQTLTIEKLIANDEFQRKVLFLERFHNEQLAWLKLELNGLQRLVMPPNNTEENETRFNLMWVEMHSVKYLHENDGIEAPWICIISLSTHVKSDSPDSQEIPVAMQCSDILNLDNRDSSIASISYHWQIGCLSVVFFPFEAVPEQRISRNGLVGAESNGILYEVRTQVNT